MISFLGVKRIKAGLRRNGIRSSFYTHVFDLNGPYYVRVVFAATHEAPYVLEGLMHHGTSLKIDTYWTWTAPWTTPFILCAMLDYRADPNPMHFRAAAP